jgi:hypothetical protein
MDVHAWRALEIRVRFQTKVLAVSLVTLPRRKILGKQPVVGDSVGSRAFASTNPHVSHA